MKTRTMFTTSAAILATVLIAVGSPAASAGQAASPEQTVGSRANLVPPAGNVLIAEFAARGVQVYECVAGKWEFKEPAANLIGLGKNPPSILTTIHFRGPSWESTDDGSVVEGKFFASSPVAGSIPELLLASKLNRGDGIFGRVTFIHRLNTNGGLAPATACTDGKTIGVRYRADYRFFVAG